MLSFSNSGRFNNPTFDASGPSKGRLIFYTVGTTSSTVSADVTSSELWLVTVRFRARSDGLMTAHGMEQISRTMGFEWNGSDCMTGMIKTRVLC